MHNELLSSYKLNEGSGNIVYDYSITRYGLSGYGNISNCWIGKDLYLEGQTIQVPNKMGLKNLTNFTILSDIDFKQKKITGSLWGDLGFESGYLKYGPIQSIDKFQSGYVAASVSGKFVNLYINGQTVGTGVCQSVPWNYQIGGALSAKIKDFRIYGRDLSQEEVSLINNENFHLVQSSKLFGSPPNTINNAMNLFIGAGASLANSGLNLSAYGQDLYLLDEQGVVLYDEHGNPLLPESGIPIISFYGFDCYMSGTQDVGLGMNLFLEQSGLTNPTSNSLPLYLLSSGFVGQGSINLYLSNLTSGAQSGVNLSIEGDGGLGFNDGNIPVNNAMNLFIKRNENSYMTLFMSGAAISQTGNINLTLSVDQTQQSGSFNISMPTIDTKTGFVNLYTFGGVQLRSSPPTVPDAPILSAVGFTSGSVTFAWTIPNDNGSPIYDYEWDYSSDGGLVYNAYSHSPSPFPEGTITGVPQDTDILVKVAGINSVGRGPFSNIVTIHTDGGFSGPEELDPLWYINADTSNKWAADGTTLVTTAGTDIKYVENLGIFRSGQMATNGNVTVNLARLKNIGSGHFSIYSKPDGPNFGTYLANSDGNNALSGQNIGEMWSLFKIYSAGNSTPAVLGSLGGTLPWWTDGKIYIRDFTGTQFVVNSPIASGGATDDVWCLRISASGTSANKHKTYLNKLSDVQTLINTGTATADTNASFSPQFGNVGYNGQNYNGLCWIVYNNPLSDPDAALVYNFLQLNFPHTFSG